MDRRLTRKYTSNNCSILDLIKHRELGDFSLGVSVRTLQDKRANLYRYTTFIRKEGIGTDREIRHFGCIFNLEFSPLGDILVAAFEQNHIGLFDPRTKRSILTLKAHDDCVNFVKFLDTRIFATCSDDNTIALWDLRQLKGQQPLQRLRSHTCWVKNIDYSTSLGALVTSGFDGNIFLWDINKFQGPEVKPHLILQAEGLLRSRLTPDARKLVISTVAKQQPIVVFHDLDPWTLASDVPDFHDECDRVRLLGDRSPPASSRSRNRMEIITDFPYRNTEDHYFATSLELHPDNTSIISRVGSSYEKGLEFTVVHDIRTSKSQSSAGWTSVAGRMTHYIREDSDPGNYIRELAVSPDGRLISSPYGFGLRLLAFDPSLACPRGLDGASEARPLHEVKALFSHRRKVLTTKFSPVNCLLASGCKNGVVQFYQPKL